MVNRARRPKAGKDNATAALKTARRSLDSLEEHPREKRAENARTSDNLYGLISQDAGSFDDSKEKE